MILILFTHYHRNVSDTTFNSRIDALFSLFLIVFTMEVIRTGVVSFYDDTPSMLKEQRLLQQQHPTRIVESNGKSKMKNPAYTTNELLSKMKHYTHDDDETKNGERMSTASNGGGLNYETIMMQQGTEQQQVRRTPQDIMKVLGQYCQNDSTLC